KYTYADLTLPANTTAVRFNLNKNSNTKEKRGHLSIRLPEHVSADDQTIDPTIVGTTTNYKIKLNTFLLSSSNTNITITKIDGEAGTNPGDFSIVGSSTLPIGARCGNNFNSSFDSNIVNTDDDNYKFQIAFTPTAVGTRKAKFRLSNGSEYCDIMVTGEGLCAPVTLTTDLTTLNYQPRGGDQPIDLSHFSVECAVTSVTAGDIVFSSGNTSVVQIVDNNTFHFIEGVYGNATITARIPKNSLTCADASVTFNVATLDTFHLTAKPEKAIYGTVTGSGDYAYNTNVTCTVTANAHATFDHWSNGDANPTTQITVTKDTTLTAYFVPEKFTVSVVSNDINMGKVSVSNNGLCAYGDSVLITATPEPHHYFIRWSNGMTSPSSYVYATSDETITAYFGIESLNVTVNSEEPDKGTVSGGGRYPYGSNVQIFANPIGTYRFVRWSNGDTIQNPVIRLTSDTVLSAHFSTNSHRVKAFVNDTAMGYVTGAGHYGYGETATLIATPANTNYYFKEWSSGETSDTLNIVITQDTDFMAYFYPKTPTVTVINRYPSIGDVVSRASFPYGTVTSFTASLLPHYSFLKWNNDSTDITTSLTVTADTTIIAYFEKDSFNIVAIPNDGSMGVVAGTGRYAYGDPAILCATPETNYHFVDWSNGSFTNPQFIFVTQDDTITANFAIDSHKLNAIADNASHGSVSGSGKYVHGTDATIIATAADHYHFTGWSNGETANPLNLTIISDTTVVANFVTDQYTLTVLANDSSLGHVTGSGTYNYGTDVSVTATTAHPHYI
ncbi:MAG: InlB B-repeat-containing protein, partial [Paludibacteraceae bacterium]|nr:InlB B-repeat-containing protein [Paludibacteraceae bacterium]